MKTIDELFPIMDRRDPPRPFPGLTIVRLRADLTAIAEQVVADRQPA